MGIVRNSINITGIISEDILAEKIRGRIIEYSEVEYISIPEDNPRIRTIHQISYKVDASIGRTINSPTGKILVLDGEKKIKIVYSHRSDSKRSIVLDLILPFNTFLDLPENVEDVDNVSVYVLDAYFDVVEGRKIYSHILYMVSAYYTRETETTEINENEMTDVEDNTSHNEISNIIEDISENETSNVIESTPENAIVEVIENKIEEDIEYDIEDELEEDLETDLNE